MKNILGLLILIFAVSCSSNKKTLKNTSKNEFVIAFGSCNKASMPNLLWDDIANSNPDIWIWGGDIIYADTDDMDKLARMYKAQNDIAGYKKLKDKTPIVGTWDDHDYGLNDGGVEFGAKKESQQEFLSFMGVAANSPRRK